MGKRPPSQILVDVRPGFVLQPNITTLRISSCNTCKSWPDICCGQPGMRLLRSAEAKKIILARRGS